MTPALMLLLAAAQAGLLLWGAVHLSNIPLRPKKFGPLCWAALTLALALGIAKYSATHDRNRALCSAADCIIIALSVAGVRVLAVNKEEEQLALDHAEAMRLAAEAAEALRKTEALEAAAAAAATLEVRLAAEDKQNADPNRPPRHLTPSLLRGGAPSPRLPTSPRK